MRTSLLAATVIATVSFSACLAEAPHEDSSEDATFEVASDAVTDGKLGVTCSPSLAYALPGDKILMRGNVRGSSNKNVIWSTTDGEIDDSATFTAPSTVGRVTVTATAEADGKSNDTCDIEVIAPPEVHPGEGEGAKVSPHTALGIPGPASVDPAHYLLVKAEFVISYNGTRKGANWVSWLLDGTSFGGAIRTRTWRSDTTLPSSVPQAYDSDYTNSGYDRGHMCPSGDRTRTEDPNRVTFTLSNALPQAHNVNAGPWEELEGYLQGLAIEGRQLFIMAGGVYDDTPPTIGRGVAVPGATWKVAVVLDRIGDRAPQVRETTRVIAVLMPNDDAAVSLGEDWRRHRVRVRDIEAVTGLNLLADLDGSLQDVLEERVDAAD